MSENELGLPFDIHGGATDLIFPHHENELAQSEAATGKQFVRYWMHGGLLQVNAEKMSKSLGNFMLLRDVLASYPAPVVRLLMLQTHYRSPLDFSTERLDEAQTAYERLANVVRSLRWLRSKPAPGEGAPGVERAALEQALADTRTKFESEMDDDFNTAGALGAIFELARHANGFVSAQQASIGNADLEVLERAEHEVTELLSVLGVTVGGSDHVSSGLPAEVLTLAAELAGYAGRDKEQAVDALLKTRAAARTEKDWELADSVRDGLARLGVTIEDTAGGARVIYRQG